MEYFVFEAALLMLAAYLLGAILGCLVRRLVTRDDKQPAATVTSAKNAAPVAATAAAAVREAPEPVQPKIETVANPTPPQDTKVAESARFERVLANAPAASATPAPSDPAKASTASEYDENSVSAAGAAAAAAAAAVAATAIASTTNDTAKSDTTTTAEAPSPDVRLPSVGGSAGSSGVSAPVIAAAVAAADSRPADDLRNIRGIDEQTAGELNQLGYTHYSQIAAWTSSDIDRVRGAFGDNRATKGSWIEQAKVLASGQQTSFVKRKNTATEVAAAPASGLLPAEPIPASATSQNTQPDNQSATTQIAATAAAAAASASTPPTQAAPQTEQSATAEIAATAALAAAAAAAAAATASDSDSDATTMPAVPDDLKKIEGIDAATEELLNENGVSTYAQIAKWTQVHVEKVDGLVGKPGRVSEQNWIEQAQILANGKQTAFSSGATRAPRTVVPTPAVAPLAPEPKPGDDLTRIQGLDEKADELLRSKSVTTFAQIANWTPAHEEKVGSLLSQPGRVEKEKWIAQAKLLAAGEDPSSAFTAPTPTTQSSDAASDTVPEQIAAAPTPARPSSMAAAAAAATAATGAAIASATTPASDKADEAPAAPAPSTAASAAPATPASPAAETTSPARPTRLADAIRQNTAQQTATTGSGVAGMRSVRSQLLSGKTDAPAGNVDDLKKIRGIGVLIEKKLNAMGVHSYEQIAQWSAADIDRISRVLDFKGRIEREGWVQQARILTSGGQTEFSKRLT